MSRVERILNGTYTGPPLSRLEELLMNGALGGGGGSVDLTGMNRRISIVEDTVDNNTKALLNQSALIDQVGEEMDLLREGVNETNQLATNVGQSVDSVWNAIQTQNEVIQHLQIHAVQDGNVEVEQEDQNE